MFAVKKILMISIVVAAMCLCYYTVSFLKAKIDGHRNFGAFLLLVLLSFASVFIIIVSLGFLFSQYRNFFFTH